MSIGKIAPAETELNFRIVWAQLPADVRSAFIGGGDKVKLPAGFRLYKYTEFGIANRGKITEWWSPVDAYENDAGLMARQNLARHLGATPGDLSRVVAAVKENWNALTHLLQAQITKPVYGFWGQCSMQRRLDDPAKLRPGLAHGQTHNLPGFAWQFYIPNLTGEYIREISRTPA